MVANALQLLRQDGRPPERIDVALAIAWLTSVESVPCKWTLDSDGFDAMECERAHQFTAGTVADNNYRFCPYCGRKIEAAK